MSPVEVQVTAQKDDILVEIIKPSSTQIQSVSLSGPDVLAIPSVPVQVVAQKDDILVSVAQSPSAQIQSLSIPGMQVIAAGNIGPPGPVGPIGPEGPTGPQGPQGQWESLTQAEYDALDPSNPDTLYVIVN